MKTPSITGVNLSNYKVEYSINHQIKEEINPELSNFEIMINFIIELLIIDDLVLLFKNYPENYLEHITNIIKVENQYYVLGLNSTEVGIINHDYSITMMYELKEKKSKWLPVNKYEKVYPLSLEEIIKMKRKAKLEKLV